MTDKPELDAQIGAMIPKAETLIGPAQERFEVMDKRRKIYKRRNSTFL